jgi:quinohemoprotein ethanol dehydrogenase
MIAFLFEMKRLRIGTFLVAVCALLVGVTVTLNGAGAFSSSVADNRILSDSKDGANWGAYGRTYDDNHYSPLTEINESNVARLKLAWSIDVAEGYTTYGAPLAVSGILYYPIGLSVIQAVNAETGRELWRYDPQVEAVAGERMRVAYGIRGLAYLNGKIYTGTHDGRLIAVNATTGKLVWEVQTLPEGSRLFISGPPRAYKNKVLIGNGGGDGSPSRGFVTAYDAETGKQIWRFYIVPGNPKDGFENNAMQMAAKTWKGEWWKHGGGGAAWNSMTYDPELNRVYIGTGNGGPWNQKIRSPGGGDNLFLCSIVALDADTGEYIWHYQTTPGETWDYTSTMDIELATLSINGRNRRVMLHAPKNGFFYVIDRDTGKLISAEPYTKVSWASRIDLASGRPVENPEVRYTRKGSVIWPFPNGGHNWQPMSFSPKTGLVYIPTTELPGYWDDRGVDIKNWKHSEHLNIDNGVNLLASSPEIPKASTHPGSIQAWNPVTQKQVWSMPQVSPTNGGVTSTGGNLVFQGQADGKFVARSAKTGKELWSFNAQNGILAPPITYLVKGQQYVTVITGFTGTAGVFGQTAAQFGWDYRTQLRRVLTFTLNGKATLPPPPPKEAIVPIDDSSFKIDQAKASKGEKVYTYHCFACHGVGAIAGGTAPDLRASQIPLSSEAFDAVVREGALESQRMPKFGELSSEDTEAIRHYIRQRARTTPSNDDVPRGF